MREREAELRLAQEVAEERKAEEEYGEFLRREAQRLTDRGFQAKVGKVVPHR